MFPLSDNQQTYRCIIAKSVSFSTTIPSHTTSFQTCANHQKHNMVSTSLTLSHTLFSNPTNARTKSKDSSHTYIHLSQPRIADLFEVEPPQPIPSFPSPPSKLTPPPTNRNSTGPPPSPLKKSTSHRTISHRTRRTKMTSCQTSTPHLGLRGRRRGVGRRRGGIWGSRGW